MTEEARRFTVEEPPAPSPKRKVGRENVSAKAVEFCSANPERWCKVFSYSFTDAQTRHRAYSNIRQRMLHMRLVCESLGLSVEFTHAEDEALARHDLYAKVRESALNG